MPGHPAHCHSSSGFQILDYQSGWIGGNKVIGINNSVQFSPSEGISLLDIAFGPMSFAFCRLIRNLNGISLHFEGPVKNDQIATYILTRNWTKMASLIPVSLYWPAVQWEAKLESLDEDCLRKGERIGEHGHYSEALLFTGRMQRPQDPNPLDVVII